LETDFSKLDLKKHQDYIIERLLEYGNEKAYKWVLNNFSFRKILGVINKSRKVSDKTKNFVKTILRDC